MELTTVLQNTGPATSPEWDDAGEREVVEDNVAESELEGENIAIGEEVERDLEEENEATRNRNEQPEPDETKEVKDCYPRRNRRPPDYY